MASLVDFYKSKLAPKLSNITNAIDQDKSMAGTQLAKGGLINQLNPVKQFFTPKVGTLATTGRNAFNSLASKPINVSKSIPGVSIAGFGVTPDMLLGGARGVSRGVSGFTNLDKVVGNKLGLSTFSNYQPQTTKGKIAETVGGLAGYGLGVGKILSPAENVISAGVTKALPKIAPKVARIIAKPTAALLAEAGSSAPLSAVESLTGEKSFGQSFKENVGAGVTGRLTFGALPLLAGMTRGQGKKEIAAALKNEPGIMSLAGRFRNLDNLDINKYIKESVKLRKSAEEILAEVSPDTLRALNKYAKDPETWTKQAIAALEDKLVYAKNPDINLGFQAREMKKVAPKLSVEPTGKEVASIKNQEIVVDAFGGLKLPVRVVDDLGDGRIRVELLADTALGKKGEIRNTNKDYILSQEKKSVSELVNAINKERSSPSKPFSVEPVGGKPVAQGGLFEPKTVTPIRKPLKEVYKEQLTKAEQIPQLSTPQETIKQITSPVQPSVVSPTPRAELPVVQSVSKIPKIDQPSESIIQEARKQIGTTPEPPKETVKQSLDKLYTQWVDRYNPLTKASQIAKKTLKSQGAELRPEYDPTYLVRRLTGAGGIADARFRRELNPILKEMEALNIPKPDMDVYLANKRMAGFGTAGRDIYGVDPVKAGQVVSALEAKYPQINDVAQKMYAYQDKGLNEIAQAGFLSPEQVANLKSQNPDYAPLYRVMDEMDEYLGLPTRKTMQGTSPISKIKGSTRKIESPVESIIANTFRQRAAIEKNAVARSVVDLQKITDLGITPLRTAENVKERISLYTLAKDIKPLQDSADKLLRRETKNLNILERQINSLEKRGLLESLKKSEPDRPKQLVSAIKTTTKDPSIKFGQGDNRDVVIGGDLGYTKIEDVYATSKNRGEQSTKRFIDSLITQPDSYIQKLKSMVANREGKLPPIIDKIDSLRDEYEAYRSTRFDAINEARLLKDAETKGKDTIVVWKDGVKEIYEVPKEIAETARGVNEESMNLVLKVLQAPASLLRQGATGRNPEFMLPNIIRDQLDAAVASKYGYVPFVDFVSGLKSMITNDDVYKKWESSGAKIDLGELSGKKDISALFNEKVEKKKLFSWLGDALDVMGKYSEQPTRVGLFKKAYQKTGNELLSAMESRDATVDFARMGSKMKVANSIVPFLNVGVQGFDKLIRSAKNEPGKLALNLAVYAVAPQVMSTLYNLIKYPEEYKEVPQYEKDSNFVFVNGRNDDGTVNYITIPKGNIMPVATNPTQSFLEYAFSNDPQSFKEMALRTLSGTLPVLGEGSSLKEIGIKTIGQNLPQALKPITENLLNKSFYKYDPKKEQTKDIVPTYMQNKLPYQQKYDFTPQMYQKIGAVLNASPLKVQNLMEGYLAGYSKIPTQIVESLYNLSKGNEVSNNDKTILRRFMKTTYPSSSKPAPEKQPVPSLMERVTGKVGASEVSTTKPVPEWQIDSAKETLKNSDKTSTKVGNLYLVKQTNGDVTKLDISNVTKMPSTTNYEQVKKEVEKWKVADDILKLDPTDQQEAFKQLGISKDDAEYYTVAKDSTEAKAAYIKDQVQGVKTYDEFLKKVAPLAREVNGQKILSDGVVDWMYQNDIITSDQKKQLKSLEYDNVKKVSKITAKKGTVKKVKAVTLPKFNLASKVKKVKRIRTKEYKLKI